MIGIPALLLSVRQKNVLRSIFKKPDILSSGLIVLAAASFSLAAAVISGFWLALLQLLGINVVLQQSLPMADNMLEFVHVFLMAAIIPAFSEEFMFRGLLQTLFNSKFNRFAANILCALSFSILHFSMQGFAALFVMGFFLSTFMSRYHSIYLTITFHAVYNAVVLILQTLQSGPSVRLIFLSTGIYLSASYLLFRKREENVWN